MEHHRRQAKALVRAFRAHDEEAVARAAAVLGERAHERFLLSDAQHVVARELGFRTWAELKHAQLPEDAVVETDVSYGDGDPVQVRVRRRERRITVDDDGIAVAKAGRPPGWYAVAEQVVAEDWLNLNRRGVVFVPVVAAGPGLDALVRRVADRSAAVYQALLELDA